MKLIELKPTKYGKYLIVDDADYERAIKAGPWRYITTTGYAARSVRGRFELAHQFIMGTYGQGRGSFVDHSNGDRLDCRRENLEVLPQKYNNQNRGKFATRDGRPCSSRFIGVHRRNYGKSPKYRAMIHIEVQTYNIGTFACEECAAIAYDLVALRFFRKPRTNHQYPRRRVKHDDLAWHPHAVEVLKRVDEFVGSASEPAPQIAPALLMPAPALAQQAA